MADDPDDPDGWLDRLLGRYRDRYRQARQRDRVSLVRTQLRLAVHEAVADRYGVSAARQHHDKLARCLDQIEADVDRCLYREQLDRPIDWQGVLRAALEVVDAAGWAVDLSLNPGHGVITLRADGRHREALLHRMDRFREVLARRVGSSVMRAVRLDVEPGEDRTADRDEGGRSANRRVA